MLCILGSFSGRDVKGSSEQRGAVFFLGGGKPEKTTRQSHATNQGRIQGGGARNRCPPLQLEKI